MISLTKSKLFFIASIFLIAFLSFWQAFSFDFWGEDWEQLWFAVFDPPMINNPSEMQHPIVIYEELLLARFFKFNPFYWQIAGFMLKVLDTFAVSLMVLGLTKSKKAAFFAGLIFASFVGGTASVTWVAAHASALVIPFLCLGIYFWVLKRKYLLALLFLLVSFWADPARGIAGGFMVILWEILSFIEHPEKLNESVKRVSILLASLLFIFLVLKHFYYGGSVSLGYNLHLVFAHPFKSLNNLLTNIGNLLIGWMIPVSQNAFAISEDNIYGRIAGYFFFFQTIYLIILFLHRKSGLLKKLLFFSIWIPIFFLPNWLLSSQEMIGYGWVLGVSHRYLTLSSVGVVGLLAVSLFTIRNNSLKIILLSAVIISNIAMSNWILNKESFYRSTAITNPIWERIDKDVPAGEKNSLFTFQGEDKTRLTQLSQAKVAFAIRRDIRNFKELPKSTVDSKIVKALLCGQEIGSPQIALANLHVWRIVDNNLENISEKARNDYKDLDCNNKHQ